MKVVYASRMGHVEGIIKRLGITDALQIIDGTEKIDGDYAYLRKTDEEIDEPKLVARALLPAEIREESRLKYEMLQYEIIG